MGTFGVRQMLLKGPQGVINLESLVKKLSQRDVPDTILILGSDVLERLFLLINID